MHIKNVTYTDAVMINLSQISGKGNYQEYFLLYYSSSDFVISR